MNSYEIHDLLYSPPFIYNESPWVKKIVLTLCESLSDDDFSSYTKERLEKKIKDKLKYEYECVDPPLRNKLFDIKSNSIDSKEFRNIEIVSELNRNEKRYLNQTPIDEDTKNLIECKELNINNVKDICEIPKKIIAKDIKKVEDDKDKEKIEDDYSLKYCSEFILKDVLDGIRIDGRKKNLKYDNMNGDCNETLPEFN